MKKIIILIILITLGIMIIIFSKNHLSGQPMVLDIDEYDENVATLLESACRCKYSSYIVIKHVTVTGGKDWMLYSKIILNVEDVETYKRSIEFDRNLIEPNNLDLTNQFINWWKIDMATIDYVERDSQSFTDIFYIKPTIEGKVAIYMSTDGGKQGFSKEVWDMIKQKGAKVMN